MSDSNDRGQEQWGSQLGVILAVAGSAVGLGNFLRFPGQAAQNGGGAFMLPYFAALIFLGIPMCWAEWTMGRYGGSKGFNSAPGIFTTIWPNRIATYFGTLALLIPLVIYMYYVLIEAWCLGYAYDYLVGNFNNIEPTPAAYSAYFDDFVGKNADGFIYEGGNNELVSILAFVFVLNFILIYRGISKGIEKFCNVAMPLMAVCAICVLIRVLTLGTPDPANPDNNLINGLGSMWNPNPEFLWKPDTWLAAAGQIFFSISAGFGIIINYSSYLKKKDDVALSGLTSCSVNEFFEVCLGGMITLPAAFIFLGASATMMGTFGLGFNALPNVFAVMPGGRFFGFVWFFMLFLAAITSSLSMLQPVIAFFEEGLGLKRHASVTFLGLIAAFGTGFCVYFSKDTAALDTMDFWVGTFLIYVLAMFQTLLYGWGMGIEKGEQEMHHGAHLRVPRIVQFVLKYVSPTFLFIVFFMFCWQSLVSKEVQLEFLPGSQVSGDIEHGIPDVVTEVLGKNKQTVPASTNITTESESKWTIRDADSKPLYTFEMTENEDGLNGLRISKYSMGTVQALAYNKVALISIGFIAIVGIFMGILTNIACRRWEREGRW
jgi:NSS family neurotransmitter:Na+ symporter